MSQASQLSFISSSTGQIVIAATTASVSTTTGALQVAGGVGVGGDVYIGGTVTATTFVGNLTGTASKINLLNVTNGPLPVALADTANSWIRYNNITTNFQYTANQNSLGNLNIGDITASTSTTTGALTVAGGVGVGGGLYVGGTVTATNLTLNTSTIALGANAAGGAQNAFGTIAIGAYAGQQGGMQTNSIAIGNSAATNGTLGSFSIAIGYAAANSGASAANSIMLNASGNNPGPTANAGFYVLPIRPDATSSATTFGVYYNPVTKELTTSTAATGGGITLGNVITTALGWNLT